MLEIMTCTKRMSQKSGFHLVIILKILTPTGKSVGSKIVTN